jgi:hypothetical protein
VFGYTVLFLFSWLVIAISIYLYSKVSRQAKTLKGHVVTVSALLALANVLIIGIDLIFLSFNRFVYPIGTFILVALAFFIILRKFSRQQYLDSIILSFSMALILNPGWLGFVGLL